VRYTLLGIVLATATVAAAAVPVLAHHSSATFDTGMEITLKGVVTEWFWANPHCFLKFDAKDDTGAVRHWAVETQNPVTMVPRGWSKSSFKVGDEVTVKLQPSKNGAPVGRIVSVLLPNGQTLVAIDSQPAAPPRQ
jgi:uncharacterized protein DUF6152